MLSLLFWYEELCSAFSCRRCRSSFAYHQPRPTEDWDISGSSSRGYSGREASAGRRPSLNLCDIMRTVSWERVYGETKILARVLFSPLYMGPPEPWSDFKIAHPASLFRVFFTLPEEKSPVSSTGDSLLARRRIDRWRRFNGGLSARDLR